MTDDPRNASAPPAPVPPSGPPWYRTVTGWILLINISVFLLQIFWDNDARQMTMKGALSLDGIRAGKWWQLLTYQALHGGFLYVNWKFLLVGVVHLSFNCVAIYVMGRVLEPGIGKFGLARVYLVSGVVGGLLHVFVAWVWPDHFNRGVVGASAGACGLVAMFATLFPQEKLKVLLFLVYPATMKADTLLWLMLIISVFGLSDVFQDGIAHAAHLGGMVAGIYFAKRWQRKMVPPNG
ncbi:MAG: protease [Verrucomicrobia bacterium]|nr:protease [Verrucomicrobiota bacterium]